jgi:beta propeller repeat protein
MDPAISGNTVVWQNESVIEVEDEFGQIEMIIDWDIWGADVTDPNYADVYGIKLYDANQQSPAIYRNNVVWQNDYYMDWDILSSDVWMKDTPVEYGVSLVEEIDQQAAAVWGDYVVWYEDTEDGQDIWAANMSDADNPVEFAICTAEGLQRNPDIADNIVVWQDFRNNDNWDIYGYNLTTGQEFQITDDPADQTNPAVSGNLVVWQDRRGDHWSIYAAEFYGAEFARCQDKTPADVNRDCLVNLQDLAIIAEQWLTCGLDQQEACP